MLFLYASAWIATPFGEHIANVIALRPKKEVLLIAAMIVAVTA